MSEYRENLGMCTWKENTSVSFPRCNLGQRSSVTEYTDAKSADKCQPWSDASYCRDLGSLREVMATELSVCELRVSSV